MNFFDKMAMDASQLQAPEWQGQQPPQQKPQGLLGNIRSSVRQATQNPDFMDKLAIGLGGMSMNPNRGIIQSAQNDRLLRQREQKNNRTAFAVVAQLKNMGETEAAQMVEANPAIAGEVLKQIVQKKYARGASPTISGIQTDPVTGQQYVLRTDPNTGQSTRVDAQGAIAETPEAKLARESGMRLQEGDIKLAQDKSAIVFDGIQSIDSQLNKMGQIRKLVTEGGARTGVINQLFPAFDAATAELRGLANSLGIDIINSATFGALSEKELSLALSTGFDTSLQGQELVNYIDSKMAAQAKLREQLVKDATMLTSGMGYQEYIRQRVSQPRSQPIPHYGQPDMEQLYPRR